MFLLQLLLLLPQLLMLQLLLLDLKLLLVLQLVLLSGRRLIQLAQGRTGHTLQT